MVPNRVAARRSAMFLLLTMCTAVLATSNVTSSRAQTTGTRLLVAFSPENLPYEVEARLDRIPGVRATNVRAGTDWMTLSKRADGTTIQNPPSNFGYPMEVLTVAPWEYSQIVTPDYKEKVRRLENKKLVMSTEASSLRRGGSGVTLRMTGVDSKVVAVVPPKVTQGYDALMAAPPPKRWPNWVRFVIMRAHNDVTKERIRKAIRDVIGSGPRLALRSEHDAQFMRYGASGVRSQPVIKKNFGDFPGRPLSDGRIEQLGSWRSSHIRTASVPILGNVTCHRKLFPQLRKALAEVKRKGLSHTVKREEYAGCYNSRFVATIPKTRISRHSWGVGLDINARSNCLGCKPTMDRRLVKIFEKWGFIWGGRFALPDGMHMEWIRFP